MVDHFFNSPPTGHPVGFFLSEIRKGSLLPCGIIMQHSSKSPQNMLYSQPGR